MELQDSIPFTYSFIRQECEAPVQAGTLVVSTCRKSLNQLLETIGPKSNVEHKHLLWAGEMVQRALNTCQTRVRT